MYNSSKPYGNERNNVIEFPNKVEEVADISKSISRNINHLSDERKAEIEIEKNRIKFMNNLMN